MPALDHERAPQAKTDDAADHALHRRGGLR
jgi:hypothetical protein